MNLWETITEWVSTNLTSLFPELNFWVTIIVVIIIVAGIVWFVVSAKRISWKPSLITEIAIACALSLILGFLKIVQMPEGGSISLAMLPVIVVAFRRGLVPGVVTGIIAGLLQMICDPFFIHPLQVLLDYPFAWGALGLAGVVVTEKSRKNFTWIIGVLAVILVAIGISAFVFQANGTSIMWDKFVMIAILSVFLSASLFIANKKLHNSIMIIAGIALVLAFVVSIFFHIKGFSVPWYMYVMIGLLISLFISMFFFKNDDLNQKIGAVAFGSLGRFLFHFISGVVFFSQFAPEGFSIAGYVALYIFTHLFFEAFVCLIVIAPIQRSSNLMEYQESDKVSV